MRVIRPDVRRLLPCVPILAVCRRPSDKATHERERSEHPPRVLNEEIPRLELMDELDSLEDKLEALERLNADRVAVHEMTAYRAY